jgi:hypothetical protein
VNRIPLTLKELITNLISLSNNKDFNCFSSLFQQAVQRSFVNFSNPGTSRVGSKKYEK